MTQPNWHIRGVELASCNCAWGCPCQFNALPTNGQCEAVWAMRIDEGHFDDTRLDGLTWGVLLWWPGAVHEGNGKQQVFGEERATPEQRQSLETIASGRVSDEGTYFQIFAAVAPEFLPAVWRPVDFDLDLEKCAGRLSVPDLVEARIESIRNPVTNAEHRARVTIPNGFEYREAEYASGTAKSTGPISLEHAGTHAHLANVGWDASGVRL